MSNLGGAAGNPYAPPTAPVDTSLPTTWGTLGPVPPSVIRMLGQTRPWVTLLSILCFVLFAVAVCWDVASTFNDIVGKGSVPQLPGPLKLAGLIYIVPATYLWRYARGIRRLQQTERLTALEDALASQKSFWKFLGIWTTIMVAVFSLSMLRSAFR
jgi:hypothetical protein